MRVTLPPDPPVAALVDAARRLDQRQFLAEGFLAFANFGCRRSLIDRVGPFNERLRSNGDREWCLRATALGARLAYAPDALVEHPARTRARDVAATWWRRGVGRGRTSVVGSGPAVARGRNWSPARAYLPAARRAVASPGRAQPARVGVRRRARRARARGRRDLPPRGRAAARGLRGGDRERVARRRFTRLLAPTATLRPP